MPRIALLANPESGSGDAEEAERLLRDRGAEVRRFALDEAEDALAVQPERIVVAGGDGSLGLAAALAARAGIPLAVLAVGTANDFARALELPDDLEGAARVAVEGTRMRRLDLARIDERPFVNAASAGLPPIAARKAEGLKAKLGPLSYAVGALRAALSAAPLRCRVLCDGEELFSGEAWQVTVGGTGAFGGGSEVDADPGDGKLDVIVFEAGARAKLAARGYGLRRGTVHEQAGVLSRRGSEVIVSTEARSAFNVDGEVVDLRDPRFTVEPGAFEVVVG